MLTVAYGSSAVTFHVTYQPLPLDVSYMRGPWLAWLRCPGLCHLLAA